MLVHNQRSRKQHKCGGVQGLESGVAQKHNAAEPVRTKADRRVVSTGLAVVEHDSVGLPHPCKADPRAPFPEISPGPHAQSNRTFKRRFVGVQAKKLTHFFMSLTDDLSPPAHTIDVSSQFEAHAPALVSPSATRSRITSSSVRLVSTMPSGLEIRPVTSSS